MFVMYIFLNLFYYSRISMISLVVKKCAFDACKSFRIRLTLRYNDSSVFISCCTPCLCVKRRVCDKQNGIKKMLFKYVLSLSLFFVIGIFIRFSILDCECVCFVDLIVSIEIYIFFSFVGARGSAELFHKFTVVSEYHYRCKHFTNIEISLYDCY